MATRYASLSRIANAGRSSDFPPSIRERDVIAALLSRDECATMLGRMASIPSARSGNRALLALIARLAPPACTWLEGELAVELYDDEEGTRVRIMSELGGGLRERVLPSVTLPLSFTDLVSSFTKSRQLTHLLRLERVSTRCALLLASESEEATGRASAELDISETSLAFTAGDQDVDSGWDDAPSA